MTTEDQSHAPGHTDVSRVVDRLVQLESLIQTRGLFELPMDGAPPAESEPDWLPQHHWRTEGQLIDDQWLVALVEMAYREVDARTAEQAEGGGPSEAGVRVKVDGTFVVVYRLKPGPSLSAEEVREFAAQNGAFNVRPFWREYLHSSLLRAGPNAFLAPLMKLHTNRAPAKGESAGPGGIESPPRDTP